MNARIFLFAVFIACVMTACDKPYTPSSEGSKPDVVAPGGGSGDVGEGQTGEVLWAENDTARFYLQRHEVKDVTLTEHPTPSSLINDPRYRLPTRLEAVRVLKIVDTPAGCWLSKQRILCFDDPKDKDVKTGSTTYGTGQFYSFVPHGNVTKAGVVTRYCLLPVRTVRTKGDVNVDITVNDEWN